MFLNKGSLPSLFAGVIFGCISGYGAFLISSNNRIASNYHLAILSSGALLAVMGLRFFSSFKFMPAGLIALLSFAQLIRLLVNYSRL
jgi:uncharacterized membrane protein (UPF0136 family)